MVIAGKILPLSGVIFHDDRKPLARWFASQRRYAHDEAEHLLEPGRKALGGIDRIRLAAWPAPLAIFIYTLIVKGCLLDGWPGWYYALQRLLFETNAGARDHRSNADCRPGRSSNVIASELQWAFDRCSRFVAARRSGDADRRRRGPERGIVGCILR